MAEDTSGGYGSRQLTVALTPKQLGILVGMVVVLLLLWRRKRRRN